MLKKIAYVELAVANLVHSTFYFEKALGFHRLGYTGLETGEKEVASVLLAQNNILLILNSGLSEESSISKYVSRHGDSIHHIAFIAEEEEIAYQNVAEQGVPVHTDIYCRKVFNIFGDVTHSFLRDWSELEKRFNISINRFAVYSGNLDHIDHLAICVNTGAVDKYTTFYLNAFGWRITHTEKVDTGSGGMDSKVIQNLEKTIKLVFVEPLAKYRTAQLNEFLRYYNGEGVQHLAYATQNIRKATIEMREKGLNFLRVPLTYYEERIQNLPDLKDKIESCKDLDILIDRDHGGELYQTFSKPIQTKPTCFFELIERHGNEGFGSENIKALFRAIEREQAKRGTL